MAHRGRTRRLVLFGVGSCAAAAAVAARRFAVRYRERVGLPHRSPVTGNPADLGLAFEKVAIPSGEGELAAWFIPASTRRGRPLRAAAGASAAPGRASAPAGSADRRPGIAILHGWESNRGRSQAHARYLNAAGFHCLVIDVLGHGDNVPETLPVSVPEFAETAAAAARWLSARPEVSQVGLLGHSMGGAGVIIAASREPVVKAVASLSAPADLVRMTRKTFEMADMRLPDFVAMPLAVMTARTLLAPRGHSLVDASAVAAARRYGGPLLLAHGAQDHGVPVRHLHLIAGAARDSRDRAAPRVETLILPEFGHRWLYESPECRKRVARFFAESLGGPVNPAVAGRLAEACAVARPVDPDGGFGALAAPASSH